MSKAASVLVRDTPHGRASSLAVKPDLRISTSTATDVPISVAFLFNRNSRVFHLHCVLFFNCFAMHIKWRISYLSPATLNRRLPRYREYHHQPRKFRGWFYFQTRKEKFHVRPSRKSPSSEWQILCSAQFKTAFIAKLFSHDPCDLSPALIKSRHGSTITGNPDNEYKRRKRHRRRLSKNTWTLHCPRPADEKSIARSRP